MPHDQNGKIQPGYTKPAALSLAKEIAMKLTRDQLAVAVLSYLEHTMNVSIPGDKIAFELVCFARDDGEIDYITAKFKPEKKVLIA